MTVPASDYRCYAVVDLPVESEDGFQVQKDLNETGEPLVITVDGNKITVSLKCEVRDDRKTYPLTFNYNGSIKEIPEGMYE